jgi:hypothetical protein
VRGAWANTIIALTRAGIHTHAPAHTHIYIHARARARICSHVAIKCCDGLGYCPDQLDEMRGLNQMPTDKFLENRLQVGEWDGRSS